MNVLRNIEFFSFENEIWYRQNDKTLKLSEDSSEIISYMYESIEMFYPGAFKALTEEYAKCKPNINYFKFKVVLRFCKCNFGGIDNVKDIDGNGIFNFECVPCPLRGECKWEYTICRPKFNHRLSPAEMRVLRLWYDGKTKDEVANLLCLSPGTVNTHIERAFARLDIHSKSEFVKYAEQNNLFDNEI